MDFYINDDNTAEDILDNLFKAFAIQKANEKMASRYFGTDEGTKDYNTASLVDIMDYMKSHDIKQTQYYTRALENE